MTAVTTKASPTSNPVTLASNVQYLPFGPMSSLKLGNNEQVTYSFDQDYQLTGISTTNPTRQGLTIGHDPNGNITSIADSVNSNRSQTFQYDALNRVSQAVGLYGTDNFAYDPVGNFTTGTKAADSITSTYNPGSNQLATYNLTSGINYSFTYDAAGNQLTRQKNGAPQLSIAYNADGRPQTAATETYTYDGFGKRVLIGVPSAGTQDIVDPASGRLLVENNAGAQPQRTYVYLNGIPIALVSGFSSINYVLSDQLGQPQKLVDGFSTLVWDRVSDAFGATASQAKGASTAISLRFPGQEFDANTGLHYNDQRDYDPTLGRYIQPDPIGLAGGINPYRYAANNPVGASDPSGRDPIFGSIIGAGTDVLFQLHRNGGRIECVNWAEAAFAGLIGALVPVSGEIAGEAFADLMAAWAADGAGAGAAAALAAAAADAPEGAGLAAAAMEAAAADAGAGAAAAEMAGADAGLAAEAGAEGAVAAGDAGESNFVYRAASGTPNSMTPRAVDTNGLSASDSLANALSGKNQVIDTSKFTNLCAICDNPETGHVSIRPTDMSQMQDWINSRGGSAIHPLTQELLDAVVGTVNK